MLALAVATTAPAQTVVQNTNTRVELFAESAAPAPGKPMTLAVRLTPNPGWHTYWSNPGEAGVAPRAKWTQPVGAFRYPAPGQLLVSGLMNFVYEAPVTLLADLAVPAGAAGAALPVGLTLDYLVCTHEQCVPEHAVLALPLAFGDGAADPRHAADFAAARAALPKPLAAGARYHVDNGRFVIAVPFANATKVTSAYFFAAADGSVDYAAPQIASIADETIRIETKASGKAAGPVAGVLKVTRAGETTPRSFAVTAEPGSVPGPGAAMGAPANTLDWRVFAGALLFAVIGGVVLNVMPCVFPILSLKALSLARGGASAAEARRDALAYAAGVIVVCVTLGGLILILRAAGTEVGWAFQLQNPRVILGLLLLLTAIALNLAGLFEITLGSGSAGQALASQHGAAGSFWTGALAAFVATPCTGPFMAGALGAALVLPPAAGLLVFAGLGFGLALPFLLVGFIPALRTRLPRPGMWMATFRRLLSLPMFATALALAWILGKQAGVDAMTLGLGATLALGCLLWWFGRRQGWEGKGHWVPLGLAAVLSAAAVATIPVEAAPAVATTDAPGGLAAQPFSATKLEALQQAHVPVLVYFTADWCLTCKVNERGALSSGAVAAAFTKAGVKTLVGDWTNGDAAIGRFLEAHGRAGVPLYLLYHADGSVEELPQILTAERLIAATH